MSVVVYDNGSVSRAKPVSEAIKGRAFKLAFPKQTMEAQDWIEIDINYHPNTNESLSSWSCSCCDNWTEAQDSEFLVVVKWYSTKNIPSHKAFRPPQLYRKTTFKEQGAENFIRSLLGSVDG